MKVDGVDKAVGVTRLKQYVNWYVSAKAKMPDGNEWGNNCLNGVIFGVIRNLKLKIKALNAVKLCDSLWQK